MKNSSNIIWGLIFIAAGVLLLLDNYGYVDAWEVVKTYWPVVLIAIGLKILWDIKRHKSDSMIGRPSQKGWHKADSEHSGYQSTNKTDILNESNVMGDIGLTVQSDDFRGGYVNTIFGDTRVNLTGVTMADGEQTLRINGVFGDVIIDTPGNLPVYVSGNTLAGDISIREYKKSGFGQSLSYKSEDYDSSPKKLHINISQVLGDIRIS